MVSVTSQTISRKERNVGKSLSGHQIREVTPVNCTIPLTENLLPITLNDGPTVEAENYFHPARFLLAILGVKALFEVNIPDMLCLICRHLKLRLTLILKRFDLAISIY